LWTLVCARFILYILCMTRVLSMNLMQLETQVHPALGARNKKNRKTTLELARESIVD